MQFESPSQIVAPLIELVQSAPTWLSCTILFLGAFIEYVFPPFPGDTILVAGGFFISRGAIPFLPSVIALTAGSMIGSGAGWAIGHYAQRQERSRRLLMRIVGAQNLEKLSQTYAKYGNWLLFVNRFLPGVRGVFMMGAGVAGIPLKKVLLFGFLSSALWNSLLIGLGFFVSESLPALLGLFQTYTNVMIAALVIVIAIFVFRRLRRGN